MLKEHSGDRTHARRSPSGSKRLRYGTVLVDFENIYSNLAEEPPESETMEEPIVDEQALDDAVDLLSSLRDRLRVKYGCAMAIGRSYADFDRLGGTAMSQLQLLAFEPRFMIATRRKSSADILLSIDAIEMLHTRPELDVFVIVGGDRDYLPVVRRIREHLKRVILVGFKNSTSGDLRQVVGEENFIAAETLLPEEARPVITEYEPRRQAPERFPGNGSDHDEDEEPADGPPTDENHLKRCMEELLAAYYQYGERRVWLTPFLRTLNDCFPYLDNRGRKRMVEDLQARGAIAIQKIEGDPYPYSVIDINWEDGWVASMDENRGNT